MGNRMATKVTAVEIHTNPECAKYGHDNLNMCNCYRRESKCNRCGYTTYYCKRCRKHMDATKCRHYKPH